MSYVLNQTSKYELKHVFYRSRFLRIFPIYFVVTLLTLVYFAIHDSRPSAAFFDVYSSGGDGVSILLIISNLLIFFQDVVMFLRSSADGLVFVQNFREFDSQLWRGLLIPQAWALSLELMFYLIVPFIFNKRKTILTIFLISLCLKAIFVFEGVGRVDPWSYRFFPFELCWFLLGSLSHLYLLPLFYRFEITSAPRWIVIGCCIVICVFHMLPYRGLFSYVFLFMFALFLPFFFNFRSTLDSFLGGLSFPIYISHMLVIYVVYDWAEIENYKEANILYFSLVLILVFCFSVLLERYIGVYFDKLRFSKTSIKGKV